MWYIISLTDPSEKYCLLVGKDITVGRRDTDIVLATDPTVSRKHALIQVAHSESNLTNPNKLSVVTLTDQSRFGTWVNGKQLASKGQSTLNDGDQVRFGSPKSEFMCVYEPLVVSTSCLDTGQKREVRKLVCKLGGHVVKEWQRGCSLLLMTSLSVTIKVVSAMVGLKPIVTMDYLTSLQQALEKNETNLPDPNDFTPALSDPHLNAEDVSFKPNPARKTLFKEKTFVFLNNAQFNKLSLTVEMAGGMPVLQESAMKGMDTLVEDGTVVMHSDPEDPSLTHTDKAKQWVVKVTALLKRHKKRMIPDSEIGYAVVFCSVDKHCNPDLKPIEDLGIALPSQSLSEQPFSQDPEVFVPNTEVSQIITGGAPKRGKRLRLSNSQATSSGVQLKHESETVKTESKHDDTSARGSVGMEYTGDFSVDVKPVGDVLTPAQTFTPRKRARDPEQECDSMPNPKSAKKEPEKKSFTVKIKQEQEERRVSPRGRQSTQSVEKQDKSETTTAHHTDGSSSDELGTFALPQRRSKRNVLVHDTEVDTYGSARQKQLNLSDLEGPTRLSDSDTESKHSTVGKNVGPANETVNSPGSRESPCRQASPSTRTGRHNKEVEKPSGRSRERISSPDERKTSHQQASQFSRMDRHNKEEIGQSSGQSSKRVSSPDEREPSHGTTDRQDKEVGAVVVKSEPLSVIEDFDNSDTELFGGNENMDELSSPQRKRVKKSPADKSGRNFPASETENENRDVNDNERTVLSEKSERVIEERPAILDDDVPTGFLTTRLPIQNQLPAVPDFEKEEVTAQVCVEFKSLMVRCPRSNTTVSRNQPDEHGFVTWRGKRVKNYKKFRKSHHVGSGSLPLIIGGSDLEPHVNNPRKELDDWYNDALHAESQQNEADRVASQLFNWDGKPSTKGRGNRSR